MIVIIQINILIGIVIMIIAMFKRSKEIFCAGLIVTLMPIVGILYVILCFISWYIKGRKTVNGELIEDDLKEDDEQQIIKDVVEELVPISEALVLNDTKIKKEILIKVLREDKMKYIESLKEAIKDDDVEASHYAAVALVDIKDYFISAIEKASKWGNNNVEELEHHALILDKAISSGLYNQLQESKLKKDHIRVLERMITSKWGKIHHYEKIVKYFMQDGKTDEAFKYCNLFKRDFPGNEEPYICLISYYYQQKDKVKLDESLRELTESDIILSREGLKKIRFWLGDNNA